MSKQTPVPTTDNRYLTLDKLTSPTPILQQSKSTIVTNPFITEDQKQKELADLQRQANAIFDNHSFVLPKKMSSSFINVLDDILNKPQAVNWGQYLFQIITKDNRFFYLGILFLIIGIGLNSIKINSGQNV